MLNVEFNITEDSLTLFKPSVADVDPTQIHKNMCRWNVHEKSCAPFQLNKKDARQFYSYYINSLNEKTHLERNNFLEKEKKQGSSLCDRSSDSALIGSARVEIWELLEKTGPLSRRSTKNYFSYPFPVARNWNFKDFFVKLNLNSGNGNKNSKEIFLQIFFVKLTWIIFLANIQRVEL